MGGSRFVPSPFRMVSPRVGGRSSALGIDYACRGSDDWFCRVIRGGAGSRPTPPLLAVESGI
jgi:hypothetical protein